MRVIAKRTLKLFWQREPSAERPLRSWFALVSKAEWTGPADVKTMFGNTIDFIADNRVIFDVGGNKYRLIVHVAYQHKRVLVKFVGTHSEYDDLDARMVGRRTTTKVRSAQ